jgi:hypothetical protein
MMSKRIRVNGREPSTLEYIIIIGAIVLLVMCICVVPVWLWLMAFGVAASVSQELGFNPWIGIAIVGLLILLGGISIRVKW